MQFKQSGKVDVCVVDQVKRIILDDKLIEDADFISLAFCNVNETGSLLLRSYLCLATTKSCQRYMINDLRKGLLLENYS